MLSVQTTSTNQSFVKSGSKETETYSTQFLAQGLEEYIRFSNQEEPVKTSQITLEKLYPSFESESADPLAQDKSELPVARRFLREGISLLESARDCHHKKDALGADQYIMQFKLRLLPALFACRTLGDGFGIVIQAIEMMLLRQNGKFLSPSQLQTLIVACKRLSDSPLLQTKKAMELLEQLGIPAIGDELSAIAY